MCVCVCVCVYICYVSIYHPARVGCDTRPIFKRSLTGLNSKFSFS